MRILRKGSSRLITTSRQPVCLNYNGSVYTLPKHYRYLEELLINKVCGSPIDDSFRRPKSGFSGKIKRGLFLAVLPVLSCHVNVNLACLWYFLEMFYSIILRTEVMFLAEFFVGISNLQSEFRYLEDCLRKKPKTENNFGTS